MKKNNKGFSLVELIVVIAIMAILAAVAIPTFAGFIDKANEAANEDFLNQAKYAIELANAEDPDFAVTSVKVVVGDDGSFNKVTYNNGTIDIDIPETSSGSSEAEAVGEARAAIDWGYSFKGCDGKTVSITKGNDGKWTYAEVE